MSPKPKKSTDVVSSPTTRKNVRAYHTINKSEKPHLMDSVQKGGHKKKASFNGNLMSNMAAEATDCTYNTFGNDTGGFSTAMGHHYNTSVLSAEGVISKPNKN